MKKLLAVLCVLVSPAIATAQTITSIGTSTVKAADDFATKAFQDPWDMNERTDLGWWINAADLPASGYVQPVTFSGGEFTGITNTANPYVNLLETGIPNTAKIGKTGYNYPINADSYKYIAFRMDVGTANDFLQFIWNRTDIYDTTTTTAANVFTTNGYRIYLVDLTSLTTSGTNKIAWGGTIQSLRMNTGFTSGVTHKIDWIRLVPAGDTNTCRTITWSGGTSVDLYLFSGTTNLGTIARGVTSGSASPGCTTPGSGYAYLAGALPAGTYKVAIAPASGSITNTSSTTWVVNDIPTIGFTSPDPEGSSDDFATTFLNNAWDMDALTDLDLQTNITQDVNNATAGGQIRSDLTFETPAGASLSTQRVYYGASVDCANSAGGSTCSVGGVAVGKPYIDPLYTTKRGFNNRIDATRYRIATVEYGVPNLARDIAAGSISRLVWRVAGDATENVSTDIVFNSRLGANVMNKITVDMKDRTMLPLASGTDDWVNGSSAQPGLDIFRFDIHEYPHPTAFYVKRIKLAALEKANTSYTVKWSYTDASTSPTVSVYANINAKATSCATSSNTIQTLVPASSGSATWNTTSVTAGTYYICAVITDGTNTNETWAAWPIVIDHSYTALPRIVINRTDLNYLIRNRTSSTIPLVSTPAQTVRVSIVGSSSPTSVCWDVTSSSPAQSTQPVYVVTPTSGCGNGSFSIAVNPNSTRFNVNGVGDATFVVTEHTAGTTSNSPQYVHTIQTVSSTSNPPTGLVDTPASGTGGLTGSIAVTGWAIDDMGVSTVAVCRAAASGEAANPLCGTSTADTFIGYANLVDDARSDIANANTTSPLNYRAGWGYLLLTNFLPGGGDGTYTLRIYATDVEGNKVLIGSPVITCTNNSATAPFGAIDTPGQGEVIDATANPTYNNFGWVLVKGSAKASPFFGTGAAVNVVIDGVAVGAPTGWTSRSDLTALFPAATFSGVTNALGVYTFNASALTNSVHTIAWGVTADNTLAAGVGSRYFTVTGSPAGLYLADASKYVVSPPIPLSVGPDLGRRAASVGVIAASGPKTIVGDMMQRVVVDGFKPGTRTYDAYLVANGELRTLPIGASFDGATGKLYWLPGVGYYGAYDFLIVRDGKDRLPVRVVLEQPRPRVRLPLTPVFSIPTEPETR